MNDVMTMLPIVAVIVGVGLVLLVVLGRTKSAPRLNTAWYQERWSALETQFEDGQAGQTLAVISADKLLDKAMQERGFKGKTMGERLKNNPTAFGDINAIWRAHKLRNRIAHDHVNVYEAECRQALKDLRQGLRNLGALL